MAFIGHEGFDAISAASDAQPFDFGSVNSVSQSAPRYAGGQYATDVGPTNQGGGWNINNQSKVIQGGAFMRTFTSGSFRAMHIWDGTTVHVSLYTDYTTKQIKVYRGDGTTLLGTSAVLTFQMNLDTWMYVEWEVVIDNAAGTIKVWIDGASTPLLDLNSLDTQNTANAFATKATFMAPSGVDDIYLLDGSGSAPFNERLGDYRVYTLVPDGDDSVQWTRNTGATNFSAVDDSGTGGIDEDTTYVESGTVGHVDRYTLSDLPVGVIPKAVELRYVAKKTDAGTREMRSKLDSGGTNSNGSTFALTTNYVHVRRLMETDPTDSNPWTHTKVNALKPGIEVVT